MDAGPSYTVLRIKRKATEPPLSSLVIQDQDPSYPSSGSFGHPKRRRDVSYKPKPRGVFKLADTVPDSWIGQGAEGEILKERIKGLLGTGTGIGAGAGAGAVSASNGKGKRTRESDEVEEHPVEGARQVMPRQAAHGEAGPSTAGASQEAGTPTSTTSTTTTAPAPAPPGMQYRVISQPGGLTSSVIRRRTKALGGNPNLPPVVRSYAEVQAEEQARSLFRFIDAQAIASASASASGGLAPKPSSPETEDPQMAAFQDMLNEYLTLEKTEAAKREAEEEYVYDLYYRDLRDASIALGERANDGESGTAIGALIGYDDFSPPSSPSSSEPEDEADEDSNDEDFYRNDYPEDEDADEDMEGFDDAFGSSDEDGSERDSNNGGSEGERRGGTWGYR